MNARTNRGAGTFLRRFGRSGVPSRHLEAALDRVSSAVVFVDRDFRVTRVNAAARDLFTKHAATFRAVCADFDPDRIVGTCIDALHETLVDQRRRFAGGSRSPHRAGIQVGSLAFAVQFHPHEDAFGRYCGAMVEWADVTTLREQEATIAAIGRAQAIIEFTLDGRILTANEIFLTALGYRLEEIQGRHHSMFVDDAYRASAEYRAFWEKLARGEYDAGQYRRIRKDGTEVWIQASYNPILDPAGRPYKVVKFASDVTSQVRMSQALDATVRETRHVVQRAIEGDLTQRIPTQEKAGQVRELADSANTLLDTVATLVERITHASREVTAGAEEIARGNANLSQRTEEQASSLEETASSMEQMTSTVKTTADNAAQANELAGLARAQSEKGVAIVGAAVEAMSAINDASRKIADIIAVIDGIAFQTNLLALNAAVEAARAGEQGRGFAVVATEVRNLASRSAEAAKEIKSLIGDSVAKVHDGSRLVDETGKALGEIGLAVKRVTDVVAEIAAASQEQAAGIEQVNRAVTQMDELTQQNAALVEEAAAASEAIVEQARELSGLVARYRVSTAPRAASRAVPVDSASTASVPRELPRGESAARGASPHGRERRGSDRPWSRSAGTGRPAAVAAATSHGPARQEGADWAEF